MPFEKEERSNDRQHTVFRNGDKRKQDRSQPKTASISDPKHQIETKGQNNWDLSPGQSVSGPAGKEKETAAQRIKELFFSRHPQIAKPIAARFHECQTKQEKNNPDIQKKIKGLSHPAPEITWNHKKKHLPGIDNRDGRSPRFLLKEENVEVIGKRILPFKECTGYCTIRAEIPQEKRMKEFMNHYIKGYQKKRGRKCEPDSICLFQFGEPLFVWKTSIHVRRTFPTLSAGDSRISIESFPAVRILGGMVVGDDDLKSGQIKGIKRPEHRGDAVLLFERGKYDGCCHDLFFLKL